MHQQHSTTEIGKTLIAIVAFVAFVVVMLTKVPEWIAPEGGPGAPDTGKTVKMIR
jgi:hypothetical protein